MWSRRDVLKGSVSGLVAGCLAQDAIGQEKPGVFEGATARFEKANQHVLPDWAFTSDLPTPLTIRPHTVANYEDLLDKPAFGPADQTPIGNVYHGIAREWAETPTVWEAVGCTPTPPDSMRGEGWTERAKAAWRDKQAHFGDVLHFKDCPVGEPFKAVYEAANAEAANGAERVRNWGHFPIKCYKVPIVEFERRLRKDAAFPARLYGYAGQVPGPLFKFRHGQPAVVRYENHLETEVSVHLHGGHTPSHSDGFPAFYVLQGKSRDYFYPNVLPLKNKQGGGVEPEISESLSTIWYHDHGMDVTGFNVAKGLAGMAMFFADWELKLIRDGILPGLGERSCLDPDQVPPATPAEAEARRKELEHPDMPGFYAPGKEPYHNPYDLPLVLQDKVIDRATGQIAFDSDAHNGYLGDTFFVNGVAWPRKRVAKRKHRLRILNGSNARVYRLRLLSEADFLRSQNEGLSPEQLSAAAKPFLRIGKDSCLWSEAAELTSVVLAVATRADLIVDFERLSAGGQRVFYLVNTMPQFDGRGPRAKLDNGGDPRVLPLPFDVPGAPLVDLDKPIALVKFIVEDSSPEEREIPNATIDVGIPIAPLRPQIQPDEVRAVREFIFERGKGAWLVNGRVYDPTISNASPSLSMVNTYAEEWVLRNGGGGWWHPIHIHLESHQLISYEKDFEADAIIDPPEAPPRRRLARLEDVTRSLPTPESVGNHDTQILGPNTVVRIRMRFRTFPGPFVFHCHNLEHEDMRMMHNFEPVPGTEHDVNVAPTARTHGNALTLNGKSEANPNGRVCELPWDQPPVQLTPVKEAGEDLIRARSSS